MVTAATLKIILTGAAPFPSGFKEVVRSTFVQVTGISDNRVTIVNNNNKRDVAQTSTLETELEIAPGTCCSFFFMNHLTKC